MMPRKREFANWIYARELRDSRILEEVHEEERAKPYVITPLGSRVRRVVFTGMVTQKNSEENMTKMTVSDPSGNFYLTAFSNDFGSQGKMMLDSLEINDRVLVMGRVSSYKNEDKIYFNVNPEIAVKADEIPLKYWGIKASHIARRKIYAIKAAAKEKDPSIEVLTGKGYSGYEAECALRALNSYPDYNTQEIEAVVTGGSAAVPEKQDSTSRKFVLDYVNSNDEEGRGCRYEDIIAAAKNASISQADVDEILNELGSEGEIFEVSLKRYKVI